ncbi:MAG: hypothetical protein K6U89_19455, partial [Chloroflexi bacterium]|nr:hypothetical protein [Chloroflexota bacterium]
ADLSVVHAGTYNANPVSMAAAWATLTELEQHGETHYRNLFALGRTLMRGIAEIAERARRAEMERFAPSLSRLNEEERKVVEMVTQGLIKRILKDPMAYLKNAASGNGYSPVEVTRQLFNLDEVAREGSEREE